jgi:hypothetical protein
VREAFVCARCRRVGLKDQAVSINGALFGRNCAKLVAQQVEGPFLCQDCGRHLPGEVMASLDQCRRCAGQGSSDLDG